ncbi:uncharacterized protein AMSG_12020 [Thecamonas trahens ATCC 50062]|uniref:FHA domain-containing protein n=1 Tax=Thecamonas trahens ATCC 50062 TaxID=461836 RepID=A0A0L0DE41_THETB|nr:hypothetical protein AMSG_12020 [Thecamonas trahens ATCC 50062]KNC50436.1 hypothetical protein AMSG_12020 [Thecamonas trahens ATCC 50062]|eukprot:XP_013756987.1 hypothetical protein AMSG_12020 [Thecamonas trahens ATCC 50062]
MAAEEELQFKVVIVGDAHTGKSTMVRVLGGGDAEPAVMVVGTTMVRVDTAVDGQQVSMNVFDSDGAEAWRAPAPAFFRGVHGVVLVFDPSQPATLESVSGRWAGELEKCECAASAGVSIVLAAHERHGAAMDDVMKTKARKVAGQLGAAFAVFDAAKPESVSACLGDLAHDMFRHHTQPRTLSIMMAGAPGAGARSIWRTLLHGPEFGTEMVSYDVSVDFARVLLEQGRAEARVWAPAHRVGEMVMQTVHERRMGDVDGVFLVYYPAKPATIGGAAEAWAEIGPFMADDVVVILAAHMRHGHSQTGVAKKRAAALADAIGALVADVDAGEPSSIHACLEMIAGGANQPWGRLVTLNRKNTHIKLAEMKTLLGRKGCDHNFSDIPLLSSKHCRIIRKEKDGGRDDDDNSPEGLVDFEVEVVDLSTNGTFINGVKIGKRNRARLRHGDELYLCDSVAYIYTHLNLNMPRELGANEVGDLSTPEDYINAMRMGVSSAVLKDLTVSLRHSKQNDTDFTEEFVSMGGADALIESMTHLNAQPKKSSVHIDSLMECVKSLYALMNTPEGFEAVLNTASSIDQLVLLLDVNDNNLRNKVTKLLCPVATLNDRGHALVLAAFTFFKTRRRQHSRFSKLLDLLSVEFTDKFTDDDVALKRNVMMFINGVVSYPEDISSRCQLRDEFVQEGIIEAISMMKNLNDDALSTQLASFMEELAEDRKESSVGGLNLTDPVGVAKALFVQLRGSPHLKTFLDVLLSLLLLPSDDSDAWQALSGALKPALEPFLSHDDDENTSALSTEIGVDLDSIKSALDGTSVVADLEAVTAAGAGGGNDPNETDGGESPAALVEKYQSQFAELQKVNAELLLEIKNLKEAGAGGAGASSPASTAPPPPPAA